MRTQCTHRSFRARRAVALVITSAMGCHAYPILKDASATSAYGSRGSNGVILIATRRAP